MELYLNEERADVIKKYMDFYPLDGITTNPKMIGSLGTVSYTHLYVYKRQTLLLAVMKFPCTVIGHGAMAVSYTHLGSFSRVAISAASLR